MEPTSAPAVSAGPSFFRFSFVPVNGAWNGWLTLSKHAKFVQKMITAKKRHFIVAIFMQYQGDGKTVQLARDDFLYYF